MNSKPAITVPRLDANRIRPARLAHIVLRTAQHDKLVAWYKTVLNAETTFATDRLSFLTYDDEHHRIAIAAMPLLGRRNKSRAGVDHVAFTYASLGDLLATFERLGGQGIDPIWCINHGPTTSMYYEDPDGNIVELQVENFESIAAMEAWAATADFETNPIGVDFDPHDLKRRFEAGEAEEQLKRRPKIGPRDASSIPSAYVGTFGTVLLRLAKALGRPV